MVDSQADMSVIKNSSLKNWAFIDGTQTIRIKGVTEQIIQSIGTIDTFIHIHIQDGSIEHTFNVVPDEFGIPVDGLIGKDFLKTHKCLIDYDNMTLSSSVEGEHISIKINEGPSDDIVTLPARSQVFRTLKLTNFDTPQFIPNTELAPGVFISNSIATSNKPMIKILNTTEEVVSIPRGIVKSQNLSDLEIYKIDHVSPDDSRVEQLTKFFKSQSSTHSHKVLLPLLRQYSNVFALFTDKMTQNNFYQQ